MQTAARFVADHDLTVERLDSIWRVLKCVPISVRRTDQDALTAAGLSAEEAILVRDSWLAGLSIANLYSALNDRRKPWER